MKTFVFEGHSDDIFQVTGSKRDEAYSYDEPAKYIIKDESNEKIGLVVSGQYTEGGCWRISTEVIDDLFDEFNGINPLEDWEFSIDPSSGYGSKLTVIAPESVVCINLSEK